MRRTFADSLYEHMKKNEEIVLLTADLGFKMWDKIRDDLPKQFIQCGASEQAMLDIAVGLAYAGKTPVCYTITSFFMRAAETIGLYIAGEKLPIILVGSGRDDDYEHDGPSHHGRIAQDYIKSLKIVPYFPETKGSIPSAVKDMLASGKPSFISLRR